MWLLDVAIRCFIWILDHPFGSSKCWIFWWWRWWWWWHAPEEIDDSECLFNFVCQSLILIHCINLDAVNGCSGVHLVTGPSHWDAEIGTFWFLLAFKMQIGSITGSQKNFCLNCYVWELCLLPICRMTWIHETGFSKYLYEKYLIIIGIIFCALNVIPFLRSLTKCLK